MLHIFFNDLFKQKIEFNLENEIKIIANAIERNFDALNIIDPENNQLYKKSM